MYTYRVVFLLTLGCGLLGGCASPLNTRFSDTSRRSTNTQAAKAANERGLAHVDKEEFDAAEVAFREAIEQDTQYAAARNNLGLVLMMRRNFHGAAVELRMAGRLERNAREPAENLNRLYERLAPDRKAIAHYEQNQNTSSRSARVRGFGSSE